MWIIKWFNFEIKYFISVLQAKVMNRYFLNNGNGNKLLFKISNV